MRRPSYRITYHSDIPSTCVRLTVNPLLHTPFYLTATSTNGLEDSRQPLQILTILVKTIINHQYQYICDDTFQCLLHSATFTFPRSSVNKINRKVVVEKWQNHYS